MGKYQGFLPFGDEMTLQSNRMIGHSGRTTLVLIKKEIQAVCFRQDVRLLVLLLALLIPVYGQSQGSFYGNFFVTSSGYTIQGLPWPVCGIDPSEYSCSQLNGVAATCSSTDLPQIIAERLDATEPAYFLKAEFGKEYSVGMSVNNALNWRMHTQVGQYMPIYQTSDGGQTFDTPLSNAYHSTQNGSANYFEFTVRFPRGTTRGALVIEVQEDFVNNVEYAKHYLIIPVIVVGPEHPEIEVPILGTTLDPEIPYMIVHDPPGDGSTASFQDNKTMCRGKETQYARDESNMFHGSAKLGVKGTIGMIASIDYEIYVEFKGSGNVGDVGILNTTDQVCVSTGVGFSTSDLPGAEGSGDVYIGFGRELYYGVYDIVDVVNCDSIIHDKRLLYAPVPNSERKFVYTEDAIRNQIAILQQFVDDTTQNDRSRNESQNQIDVWNQVLQLNADNKNNPNNDTLQLVTYSAGNTQTHSSSIDIVNTSAITTEHYVEGTFGLDVVVNIGGSGFGLGYEYATSERFGATQNESSEESQILDYTLTDDDPGDIFSVDIVRDPMFGTPVFRLNQGSRTSCPYEGGYARDQPKLTIANSQDTEIVSSGNVNGTVASFKVDLCNESNEPRQYFLKLNAQSNLNGAEVKAAGVPLNGNDFGQEFNIPAFDCIEDLVINVSQQQGSSEQSFPNLEIFLYSFCDPEISSSIYASVFYGEATGVKDFYGDPSLLTVFPNPTSDKFNIHMADGHGIHAYELRDMSGKRMAQRAWNTAVQGDILEATDFVPGMYVLRVKSGDQWYIRKVAKF